MTGVADETEILHVVEIGEENNDTIYQNDTVVEIEGSEEVTDRDPVQSDERKKHRHKKKKSEAELLKTSLYNDLGLYFNDVMKGKFKAHEPPKDLHVDHISRQRRNIIWVNPLFPDEPAYAVMGEEDRNPFIRKVFLMVSLNLACIIAFDLLVLNVTFFNDLFSGLIGVILGITGLIIHKNVKKSSIFMLIAEYIIMYDYGRTCPCTGIAWVLVIVGPCWAIGCLIAKVQIMEVVIAFVATLAVVILCIGLACTSFDFTKYYLYLMVIGMVLGVFSLAYMMLSIVFKIKIHAIKMAISCGFAIFHSISLIIEIQMVIGGHTLEIDSSQFVLGGVLITISIIYIFINMLKLVVGLSSD